MNVTIIILYRKKIFLMPFFFIFVTLGIIALARDVPSCQGLAYLTYCLKL